MKIEDAKFFISSPDVAKCPPSSLPEYAFIGRSNVGKSSLINMLTGKKDLAKTSSTPGKTMLINHFVVNNKFHIVDLPGYGYAQRSKEDRLKLEKMIKGYILGREQMTNLFVLIDGRHLPQKIDMEFLDWLGENEIPFSIVFTKLDKLTSGAAKKITGDYLTALLEHWEELPPVFKTSSKDKRGRDAILNYIEQLNNLQNTDMKNTENAQNLNQTQTEAAKDYPGAAINIADNDKVTPALVKERTQIQNNNPRNNDD